MVPIIGVPMFCVNRNSDVNIGENIKMKIGQRIREARKAAGMTQGQLASKVGLKQNSISELENGDSIGTTHMAKFAQALGVRALWLETGMGDRVAAEARASDGGGAELSSEKLDSMVGLNLITQREASLLRKYRLATERGKDLIDGAATGAPKQTLAVVAHDQV